MKLPYANLCKLSKIMLHDLHIYKIVNCGGHSCNLQQFTV